MTFGKAKGIEKIGNQDVLISSQSIDIRVNPPQIEQPFPRLARGSKVYKPSDLSQPSSNIDAIAGSIGKQKIVAETAQPSAYQPQVLYKKPIVEQMTKPSHSLMFVSDVQAMQKQPSLMEKANRAASGFSNALIGEQMTGQRNKMGAINSIGKFLGPVQISKQRNDLALVPMTAQAVEQASLQKEKTITVLVPKMQSPNITPKRFKIKTPFFGINEPRRLQTNRFSVPRIRIKRTPKYHPTVIANVFKYKGEKPKFVTGTEFYLPIPKKKGKKRQ